MLMSSEADTGEKKGEVVLQRVRVIFFPNDPDFRSGLILKFTERGWEERAHPKGRGGIQRTVVQ